MTLTITLALTLTLSLTLTRHQVTAASIPHITFHILHFRILATPSLVVESIDVCFVAIVGLMRCSHDVNHSARLRDAVLAEAGGRSPALVDHKAKRIYPHLLRTDVHVCSVCSLFSPVSEHASLNRVENQSLRP